MPRYILEICRSSAALEKAGYDPFETEPAWSKRLIAMEICNWFAMMGLPRRMAHGKRVTNGPEFIEFDSGNPSHACGYWSVEIEVTEKELQLIKSKEED